MNQQRSTLTELYHVPNRPVWTNREAPTELYHEPIEKYLTDLCEPTEKYLTELCKPTEKY